MVRHRLGEPEAIRRLALPPSEILALAALILGVLGVVMAFVCAYTMARFVTQGPTTSHAIRLVWFSLTWFVTWGLMAAFGMVGGLIPGLIRCVRPALFGPNWGKPVDRRWLRLAGLARLWTGLAMATVAVLLAFHPLDLTAPPPHVNIWDLIAVYVVVVGPLPILRGVEFVVRHLRHGAP